MYTELNQYSYAYMVSIHKFASIPTMSIILCYMKFAISLLKSLDMIKLNHNYS